MSIQTQLAKLLHDAICKPKQCSIIGPTVEHNKLFLDSARDILHGVTDARSARKAAFGVYYAQLHQNGKREFDAVNLAFKVLELLLKQLESVSTVT